MPTIASQHLGQLAGTTWKHLLHYNDLLSQDNYLYFHVTSTKPDQHSVLQLPLVWSHFWAWKWTQKWDPEITYFSKGVGFALALVWACSVYWFVLALGCSGLVRAWFGLDLDWPGGVLWRLETPLRRSRTYNTMTMTSIPRTEAPRVPLPIG